LNFKKNAVGLDAGTLISVVVLVVLLHLCWLRFRSDTFPLERARVEVTMKTPDVPAEFSCITDGSGRANLLLKLQTASTNDLAENLAGYFYFRANYLLYPRRLYIAPESQVINKGRDWMRLDFQPDQDWLAQHHVTATWVCDLDKSMASPFEIRGEER